MASTLPPIAIQPDVGATWVEEELRRGAVWLRFRPDIERLYEQDTSARHLKRMTVSALVALLFYNVFLLADYLMIRDVMEEAIILRLVIVTPLSLLIYLLMQQSRLTRFHDAMATANVLLVVGSSAYLLVISQDPLRAIYNQGFLLVVVYFCLIQRIRFWMAVICCILSNAVFTVSLLLQRLSPVEAILAIEMTVIVGSLFILAAAYVMEREHRLFYLLSLKERLHAQTMEGISNRDALTGLYNRRALDARLRDLHERSAGAQGSLGIIILDIDHFKIYNDRLGHQAGDDCLKQVASLILSHMRDGQDDAFRFGGEEFLLLIREPDGDRVLAIAERIRRALEEKGIPHPESSTGPSVTAGFGVAHANGMSCVPADLIERADMALYAAKNQGRNRVWPTAGWSATSVAGALV